MRIPKYSASVRVTKKTVIPFSRISQFAVILAACGGLLLPAATLYAPPPGGGNGNGGGNGGGGGGNGGGSDSTPPAVVTDLTVIDFDFRWVGLQWTVTGDDDMTGIATHNAIRYSTDPVIDPETWWDAALNFGGEPDPVEPGTVQSTYDANREPETTYYFAIRIVDENNNLSPLSNIVSILTPPTPDLGWTVQTIATDGYSFGPQTMVTDPTTGNPVIAYSSQTGLKVAAFDGLDWQFTLIAAVLPDDVELAFDPTTGFPILAYITNAALRVAEWDGLTWQTSIVHEFGGGGPVSGSTIGLAIRFDGAVVISHRRDSNPKKDRGMYMALRQPGSESWDLIRTDAELVGRYSDAGFSPVTGEPRLIYGTASGFEELRFSERAGSDWPIEIVQVGGDAGVLVDLTDDPLTGDPVVFHRGTNDVENARALFCQRNAPGSWICESINVFPFAGRGGSVQFTDDGQPFVAHHDFFNVYLTMWDDVTSSWVTEFVHPFTDISGYVSLILEPVNGMHMISFIEEGEEYQAPSTLKIAIRDGGM